jgi:hypothetical protein
MMAITHLPALIAVSSRLERNKMVRFYLRSDNSDAVLCERLLQYWLKPNISWRRERI